MPKVHPMPVSAFKGVPACGAYSRRTGCPCQQPAMANGRCRLHGGKSMGPQTTAGKQRAAKANWRHGGYSLKARLESQLFQTLMAMGGNPKGIV